MKSTIASTAAGSPSKTASTAPSERLRAQPATPRERASRRVASRKKTPWTRPRAITRRRRGESFTDGYRSGMASVEVLDTDITALEVDAIANAANTELRHGGGVAGAIARAAGADLQRESRAKAPIGLGEAVETTAGALPSRWVIHAATMELGGPTSAAIVERATESTLACAERLGARSLALVAFGTGVGGFPLDEAAEIMVRVARAHGGSLE